LGGYIVGFFILFLVKNLKVPKWAQGLMPMMIVPVTSTIVVGLAMYFVIGVPIVWATNA
jgi:PTS system fructose-specific IIC component